jgi:NADH-quinone oxidoreductase subunit E
MVLIWNDTYEDLTARSFEKVLDGFAVGKPVKPGPQIDRHWSAPAGGPTTLIDPALYAAESHAADSATDTAVLDSKAKKPGSAANERESPAPKGRAPGKSKPKPN